MRILVVGGTQFVGRHVVDALLADGDEVTLFHRGQTNPDLFPNLEHRFGDRDIDLSALAQGQWDATIDPSAYVPRQVRALADALGSRGGRYVHISSTSAYANLLSPRGTEESPLVVLDDPTTEEVTGETYGGLKALCEAAMLAAFGPGGPGWSGHHPSIVRPTYVAGPGDHTGRFTWWVERIAKGGRVLAPGPRDNPFQVIDVRDLAQFVVTLAHGKASGTFHLAGPTPPFSFENFLTAVVAEVGPPDTELVWVEAEALLSIGVARGAEALLGIGVAGAELPLWEALDENRYANALDPSRAIGAGLRIRPLGETIRSVRAHESIAPTPVRGGVGLTPAREHQLFAALT
jgi:2'-hydroxyisoflavone reductase